MLRFFATVLIFLVLPNAWCVATENDSNELDALLNRSLEPRFSDLDEMLEERIIRVLVTYNNTNFFIEEGREMGFECELLKQYERHLNHSIQNEDQKIRLVFIPVHFDELIPSLTSGKGDIAAAGLTVIPGNNETIAFTTPYLSNVDKVVVSTKGSESLSNFLELSGKTIHVSKTSSHWHYLERINKALTVLDKLPITLHALSPNFETEDYLELLDAGIIEHTISDKHIASLWSKVLPNIKIEKNLTINQGGAVAWAVRKDNVELKKDLNRFIDTVKKGTFLGNIFYNRYYEKTERLENPLARLSELQMRNFQSIFQKYAKMYDFDWLRLAAQGFQETNLNPDAVSRSGAIGIMQLVPSTAYDLGFANLQDPEENIHAGTLYMYRILKRLSLDEDLDPAVKFDFALASYNAGPSRVIKWRNQAKKLGLDPNQWFNNVERVAYQDVGTETVRYVSNINKYYIAYHLATEAAEEKTNALDKAKRTSLSHWQSKPLLKESYKDS